jgi:hypothetical protein
MVAVAVAEAVAVAVELQVLRHALAQKPGTVLSTPMVDSADEGMAHDENQVTTTREALEGVVSVEG